ncbi:tubulin-binding cofactor C [Leptinotarsa decemlineata]|uniref:tubulin-binding cofactor C n=1 Tax=Leptinotarsa decemlineata TaxID=7539 RepID=UPI003D30647E
MNAITVDSVTDKTNKLNFLTKRENERKHNLQKKHEDKCLTSANNEQLDFFERLFNEKHTYIEDMINLSKNVPRIELLNHFNMISKEILTLQKYVAASNIFLRNYDLQRCQFMLQELTLKSKQLEDELLPKKKFSFKNKSKENGQIKIPEKKEHFDEVDFRSKRSIAKNLCGIFNKSNEVLILTNQDIFKKDVTLEKLENCKVFLKGSPSTLHLDQLRNCQIFSGPVSTSIFAENCENCTLVIACQQLRLHSSRNTIIYLHVTSRAIMEDCKEISIAPYNWKYDEIEDDFKNASLNKSTNNWTCIDDFNWLNEKHSPNWKEIEEKDRVSNWDAI